MGLSEPPDEGRSDADGQRVRHVVQDPAHVAPLRTPLHPEPGCSRERKVGDAHREGGHSASWLGVSHSREGDEGDAHRDAAREEGDALRSPS